MNKNVFLTCFFLLLAGCFACNSAAKEGTSNILPMDSVANIVADCFFLESEISVKQREYNVKDYASVKYNALFEKHGITKNLYVQNIKYYFTNPKYSEIIMNKIDGIIEQRVAALKDSLNSKQ